MRINKILFLFLGFALIVSCSKKESKKTFIASSPPVAAIISEIAGSNAEVINLLPPGESPHTFSPSPSTLRKAESALALIYVGPLFDEWAVDLPVNNKIKLIDFVNPRDLSFFPQTEGSDKVVDPHFFTDPLIVESIIDKITQKMNEADPKNSKSYLFNATQFKAKLKLLHERISKMTEVLQDKKVVLFHPSFVYYLKRYGMVHFASVEESPGKEPSPAYVADLIKKIVGAGVKVVFSETELPEAAAKAVAESSGAQVFQLDPIGGISGRKSYEEYILYNTDVFLKALK